MHICIQVFTACVVLAIGSTSWAYRDYFTPEQRTQLANIQTVLVQAIVLPDKGKGDPGPIRNLVVNKMEGMGYAVVTDSSEPHDVLFRVKCEERKTWEGTTRRGGDADLPDAPVRLWKGPACQLNYFLGGKRIDWQKEVRTPFTDAVSAAVSAGAKDSGAYAMSELEILLGEYDFPVVITAEWGQDERLMNLLDRPGVSDLRKLKIISFLGEMQADKAMPTLKKTLKNKNLSKQALVAMGNLGSDGIPLLIDLLKNSNDPEIQAAAAKGLGKVGGMAGDYRTVLPLLEMLDPPEGIDMKIQTEVAWALGKIGDKRALKPLETLYAKMLKIRDPSNRQLQDLKEALNWSFKQVEGCIEGC